MMDEQDIMQQQALILFDRAYRHHRQGELAEAMNLYKRSIAIQPTAEAHTFLGWAYGTMGRHDEAIAECEQAIAVDPSYGNPYNDIGVYLLEMGDAETAVSWFQQALTASRYEEPQLPRFNMGRAYEHMGEPLLALRWYRAALEIDPLFLPAERAKNLLLGKLN
ncbi:MAG: tetratricopeptide repeat protein [Anaerolineales bacterium]|nr:tetratricopeptide repeat protein [Anaerolineales bacterium]MCB8967430.1 tetratricopeptide repeat protein [Ardenticatenaceae bacterium]